jgi:hypothetical protein
VDADLGPLDQLLEHARQGKGARDRQTPEQRAPVRPRGGQRGQETGGREDPETDAGLDRDLDDVAQRADVVVVVIEEPNGPAVPGIRVAAADIDRQAEEDRERGTRYRGEDGAVQAASACRRTSSSAI